MKTTDQGIHHDKIRLIEEICADVEKALSRRDDLQALAAASGREGLFAEHIDAATQRANNAAQSAQIPIHNLGIGINHAFATHPNSDRATSYPIREATAVLVRYSELLSRI